MSWKPAESSASLALDGAVLKRLREEKRLTQLYVSKVVGVTTDTISRWENNRYPTMRRENALKLAEALEVPVEELLLRMITEDEPAVPVRSRQSWVWLACIAAGLLLVVLAGIVAQRQAHTPVQVSINATRSLPPHAAPGATIPVQVRLERHSSDSGFILREILPKGWKLFQASPPATSVDNDSGMVRWIIKADDLRDRIVYLVEVASSAAPASFGKFQGEVVAEAGDSKAIAIPVSGVGRVVVAPLSWADLDGDRRIDDSEMLQASDTVDEMDGVHIDWQELEMLWNAGGYRWNQANLRFEPVKPADGATP